MSHINHTPRTDKATTSSTTRRWSDRTVGSTLREIVLMATMFMLYRQVRHLTSGDLDQAMSNANGVVGFERRLGAFTEGSLQRLVLQSRFAIEFLDHYYVFVHFTASLGFMAWVFLRHPEAWGRIRAWFMSVTSAGLVIHVLFPLAPPRMLDQHGFVDTLHVYGPSIYSKDVTNSAANQLAAMPSLHFAWAAIVAAGLISIHGSTSKWTWMAVLHPLMTLLAIVATANHYWLDATMGGILVAAAIAVSYLVVRPLPAFARMPAAAQAPAFTRPPAFARGPGVRRAPSFGRGAGRSRNPAFTRPPAFARGPGVRRAPTFARPRTSSSATGAAAEPVSTARSLVGAPPVANSPVFARVPSLERVRISRVSTFTAVPVLARDRPRGRRHDLRVHRPPRSRTDHERPPVPSHNPCARATSQLARAPTQVTPAIPTRPAQRRPRGAIAPRHDGCSTSP